MVFVWTESILILVIALLVFLAPIVSKKLLSVQRLSIHVKMVPLVKTLELHMNASAMKDGLALIVQIILMIVQIICVR